MKHCTFKGNNHKATNIILVIFWLKYSKIFVSKHIYLLLADKFYVDYKLEKYKKPWFQLFTANFHISELVLVKGM